MKVFLDKHDGGLYMIPADYRYEWRIWVDSDSEDAPEWAEAIGCHISMIEFEKPIEDHA